MRTIAHLSDLHFGRIDEAVLQALTQIQEMTLVFVPKIVAIFVTTLLALPLMGSLLAGFMARVAERIRRYGARG